MSLISIENLTFGYEGSYDFIFENVGIRLDTDWKLGLIGRNGRGKTTFLNLLMGKFPYQGTISASTEFEFFPFPVKKPESMTIEIAEEICPQMEQWELIKELNLMNTDAEVLYRPFSTLSSGEQTKVMLAVLFLKENSFMLIDEPTNHLDMEARETVSRYLNRKKGFILISHDRTFLDSCIDHVLSINRCNIELEKGNYSSWDYNRQLREHFETVQNDRLRHEIRSLEEAAKRAAQRSSQLERSKIGFDPNKTEKSISRRPSIAAKSKKLMKQSKAMEKRIAANMEEKSYLLQNQETTETLKIPTLHFHSSRILSAEGLSISYGGRIVCKDVSFTVEQGEQAVLHGKNGCGKSSILKLICGEDISYTGRIIKNEQLCISYVPQDSSALSGNLTEFAEIRGLSKSLLQAILRKLGFSREQFTKKIDDYSAGQKKKVLIAASLCTPAHLYIWDEPLNYLDIDSRLQIEELIRTYRPTMLIVEHDKSFFENIGVKTVSL